MGRRPLPPASQVKDHDTGPERAASMDAGGALELLAKFPDPKQAAKLTRVQGSAALERAGRRDITGRTTVILTALRSRHENWARATRRSSPTPARCTPAAPKVSSPVYGGTISADAIDHVLAKIR